MIQKTLFYIIIMLMAIEAKESICTDKEEAGYGYSKEALQAYYIREEQVKLLKKKCKSGKGESCILLAMEKIYNFHPCYSDGEQQKEQGIEALIELCKKGYAEACFILAYVEIEQDKYLSMACELNKSYCPPPNKKIDNDDFLPELFTYHKDKLIRHKEVKKRVDDLDKRCIKDKNALACYDLYFLFNPYTPLIGQVNSWVDEENFSKTIEYRHKSCLYSYEKVGCHQEWETDEIPPRKWLIDRAKVLKFSIGKPKFIDIKEPTKEIKKRVKKRTCNRSRVVRYRDETFKKEWQINEDQLYPWGTTIDICTRLIPTNSSNWKLPTKKELLKVKELFDESIDFQYYWTSEQSKENSMDYWVVDVKTGTTHEVYKNNHYDKGCVYVRDLN